VITAVFLGALGATTLRVLILAHRQRRAIHAIELAGGHVAYRTDMQHGQPMTNAERWAPAWAVHGLGRDFFEDVVYVDLASCASDDALSAVGQLVGLEELFLSDSAVTDAGLVHVRHLRHLRDLDLTNTPITDDGIVHLRMLTRLSELRLNATGVSDGGLCQLRDLTQLRVLGLSDTDVSDEGLAQLVGLPRLEELDLRGTKVREFGAQEVRRAHRTARVLFTPTVSLQ
jgi:hypothetical protein